MDLGEGSKGHETTWEIQVHFKGSNTIKTLQMASKDRENKPQKVGSFTGLNAHISTAQRNI